MTAKKLFDIFKQVFPWMVEDVEEYSANRKDGGIDIRMETGVTLNFQFTSGKDWVLRRIS